jgi:hypothetical protein
MSVFLSPDDEANLFVRLLFNRELGREPAAEEQQAWVAHLRAVGVDLCLAHLRDQPEAANFRAKRGW